MKRFFPSLVFSLAVAATLSGCGSSVKLQDVPVEDRSAGSGGQVKDAAPNSSGVAPVQIGAAQAPADGPAKTAKIVYFDFDSYIIKPEFQSVIDTHAKYLLASQSRRMAIEGHTDERGGREYNLALGQKRAEAVRRAMGLLGVKDSQVEAVSFGKEKPAAPGLDEASMALNRRAEINYR
jgi:peptidoglycan-associated lipoprotein